MTKFLFLTLAIIPMIEIIILIQIGGLIGGWLTVWLIILSATVGTFLLRRQGLNILRRIQKSVIHNILPTKELMNGFFLIAAGILLITPGFLTDIFGLLLFSDRIQQFFGSKLCKGILNWSNTNKNVRNQDGEPFMRETNESKNKTTIDGVYSDISKSKGKDLNKKS